MWALLLCQLLFGLVIVVGPTANDANRVAGLASVAVSIVISLGIAMTSTRRELKLGLLAVTTTGIALLALPYTDGHVLRGPIAASVAQFMAATPDKQLLYPHILGLAVGPPVLFMIALAFARLHPLWLRGVWLSGSLIGLGVIALSDSRVAAIACVAGLLVLAGSAVVARRGAVMVLCAAAAPIAGAATLVFLGNDVSLRGREELWALALRNVGDSPLLGLGYGGLSVLFRRERPELGTNAHNLLIQTAGDFGGLGVLALVLAIVVAARAAVVDPRVSPALFRGFAACLVFVIVAGMAESVIDMTQRFPAADVTIVVPLLFAVLAVPLLPPLGRRWGFARSPSSGARF